MLDRDDDYDIHVAGVGGRLATKRQTHPRAPLMCDHMATVYRPSGLDMTAREHAVRCDDAPVSLSVGASRELVHVDADSG